MIYATHVKNSVVSFHLTSQTVLKSITHTINAVALAILNNQTHVYDLITQPIEKTLGPMTLDLFETMVPLLASIITISRMCHSTINGSVSLIDLSRGCIPLLFWELIQHNTLHITQKRIDHMIQTSQQHPKQALILATGPREDNVAAPRTQAILIKELSKTCAITRRFVKDHHEFDLFLKHNKKKYDVLWIDGHGDATGVYLGTYWLHLNDPHAAALAKHLNEESTVIFDSCRVGAGENNFAKYFSTKCPAHTKVYANTALHNVYWGLTLTQQTPTFRDLFGFLSGSAYQNGKKIEGKEMPPKYSNENHALGLDLLARE